MKKVLVPLAIGFEEIEAITIIDTLRRAGISVTTASFNQEGVKSGVIGAHGITILGDSIFSEIVDDHFDMIVLPGGLDGTINLSENQILLDLIKKMNTQGKFIAAICAAPAVLAKADILNGRVATCYPGIADAFKIEGIEFNDSPVVADGNIITSKGPATAMLFAVALIGILIGNEKRDEIASELLIRS
ncbi:MAG: DJ-1/PfpI family protein [Gammaproteobacteria bacterium]|nr:MAG: DJ-1/PfpI family protein [Gammaproteobacteria bacterium]